MPHLVTSLQSYIPLPLRHLTLIQIPLPLFSKKPASSHLFACSPSGFIFLCSQDSLAWQPQFYPLSTFGLSLAELSSPPAESPWDPGALYIHLRNGHLSLTASFRRQVQPSCAVIFPNHILPIALCCHSVIPPSAQRNQEVIPEYPLFSSSLPVPINPTFGATSRLLFWSLVIALLQVPYSCPCFFSP